MFNLLNSVSRSSLRLRPFPHFVIENALPSDIYERLSASFPHEILTSGHPSVINDRGHTRRLLRKDFGRFSSLDPIWNQFASENTSLEFFRTASQFFFSPIIDKLYPGLLPKLASIPVGPRTLDPKLDSQSALTDFQLVSNLPRSDSHTSRTPHLDNPQQLYALLYYMRDDTDQSIGGGLQLYQPKKSAFSAPHNRGRTIDPVHLNDYYTLHYSSNTAIFFLNTRSSYHAVQPIYQQTIARRSINIIGELPSGSSLFPI